MTLFVNNVKAHFSFLRFLDGMADAASWGAAVSILMKLFPNKVSQVMSWTEMVFGLGYMLGKINDPLYTFPRHESHKIAGFV